MEQFSLIQTIRRSFTSGPHLMAIIRIHLEIYFLECTLPWIHYF